MLSAWEAMFAELRAGTARPGLVDLAKHPLTPEAINHASWWHYSAALERDTMARRQRPTKADVQATLEQVSQEAAAAGIGPKDPLALLGATVDYLVVSDHKQLTWDPPAVYLKELRKHLDEGETVLMDHEVQACVAENNLDLLPGSPE